MLFYSENGTYLCRVSGRLFGSKSFIDPYTEPGKSAEKKIKWIYNRVLSATNRAGKLRTLKQDQQTAGTQICAQFFGHNAPVKKKESPVSALYRNIKSLPCGNGSGIF